MSGRPTSFYYSFLVLPKEKRDAMVAVWDFCRAVDDAVDEAQNGNGAAALQQWRDEVDRLFDGRTPETPQARQLLPYLTPFRLPRSAFEDLIDGVAMDLGHRRYNTFEELRQYCLRVASAVGLICVEIFGYRDARARDYAIDLGIALQLTNIIRDVSTDIRQARLYIPLDDMKRFGVAEDDLRAAAAGHGGAAGSPDAAAKTAKERVNRLLAHECERAKQFYRRAEAAVPRADRRSLMAARIMSAIYLDLLRSIERSNYDVFGPTIRVPRGRQARIAAWTWLKGMVG